jgi:hypothetical protein
MMFASPSTNSQPSVRQGFTAPDGSRIILDGPGLTGAGRWSCLFVARIYGSRHAFTVCQRGGADRLVTALDLNDVQVESHRGTELMFGYSTAQEASLTAWRGQWHELHIHRTGPRPSVESVTRVVDAFILTDTPEGLLVRPRAPRQVTFEPLVVYRSLPGVGSLRVQKPHESGITVPTWRGASARTGEIWRKPFTDGGELGRARAEVLILATATAVSELIPGSDDTADSVAAAEFLAGLDVAWTAA